jgi:hypothetical protein
MARCLTTVYNNFKKGIFCPYINWIEAEFSICILDTPSIATRIEQRKAYAQKRAPFNIP